MKHNKIKLAQKFMEHVWLDKDHDVDDYLIPHLIVESPLKTSIGSVNLLNSFATWFRAFPDLQYREMNIGFRGDWVAIEWAVEGNHLGEFLGVSATGKK
ncbi:ester cyclase [Vibrio sp. PP-XX7]